MRVVDGRMSQVRVCVQKGRLEGPGEQDQPRHVRERRTIGDDLISARQFQLKDFVQGRRSERMNTHCTAEQLLILCTAEGEEYLVLVVQVRVGNARMAIAGK